MKKGMLALLVIGACCGAPLQAKDWMEWNGAPLTEVQKAAEQGDTDAQFNLGVRYSKAEGWRRITTWRTSWSIMAVINGYADASKTSDIFAKRLPPEELAAAKTQVTQYLE